MIRRAKAELDCNAIAALDDTTLHEVFYASLSWIQRRKVSDYFTLIQTGLEADPDTIESIALGALHMERSVNFTPRQDALLETMAMRQAAAQRGARSEG
jgi:hypothetical protein